LDYPRPIEQLIALLARLPGIGRRSAERIALHLLKSGPAVNQPLAQAILDAGARIRPCSRCGSYTEQDPCGICADPRRDRALLCVVEGPNDILNLERAASFRGVYHALMGRISPLNGIGPDQLRLQPLLDRVAHERPTEVIIALGADVESDATAGYVADQLKAAGVNVSRIGLGLPAGGALESADEVTLARALEGRRKV
jgi:recombination protein RecR